MTDEGQDASYFTTSNGALDLAASPASNGGYVPTLSLSAGSAAIDAIPVGSCGASSDARGYPRPDGNGCDIGAYEF